jgi:hypothetical protein
MAGIKALRKIQLGREATPGTAVAATAVWRGMGTLEDTREVKFPSEDIGYISGTDRAYVPKLAGSMAFDKVEATFEQLPHILEAGIKAIGTGAADGAGTDKIYDYTLPTTAVNTIKAYTIEGGDDTEAEEMEYSFVSEFSLEGKGEEAWFMAATWLGRQISLSTFTGTLTPPTVEEMLFGKSKLYIDLVSGAFGTTVKALTLLEAKMKVKTGWKPVFTADGELFFTFAKLTVPEITLELTFEHDGTAQAEKVAWRAGTPRLIQIKCEGSAAATPGTTYTYKTLIINLAGKWEKFSKLDEKDGNDIVTGTLRARYNATKQAFGNIIVVNELATIP